MSLFSTYLDRQQPLSPEDCLPYTYNKSRLFVTIPVYDEPDLLNSLNSLASCTPPVSGVTVIVVVNSSDLSEPAVMENNKRTIHSVKSWWENSPRPFFQLRLLHAPALPAKWAGVGWARKIAMDEAIRILNSSGTGEGILAAFDADSTVTANYLTSIEAAFVKNPQYNFVNLNFCHPVDDPSLNPSLREGIIRYEIYLRYLRNAMQWSGFPHAIHTVGSSFAVNATAYVKQGGMNRRKAGEDFHFLHKIVLLGDYGHVKDATVSPAARISHRVPFGTGAALKKWEAGDPELHSAYSLESFRTLKGLFSDPGFFYTVDRSDWEAGISQLDQNLQDHLSGTGTLERLSELKRNCSNITNFLKRFYHEVNAFWIIQYLNINELNPGGKGKLLEEATALLRELNTGPSENLTPREILEVFRELDLAKN
jgi:hypothetical protein